MAARVLRLFFILTIASRAAVFAQSPPAADAPRVAFSGYIQPQYQVIDIGSQGHDRAFLRRLVLAVDLNLTTDWQADIQVDAGPAASTGNPLIVKNALIRFTGLDGHGLVVAVGNQKVPFSRSVLTSAARRVLVERPFTGERAFGAPTRTLSARVDGSHADAAIKWSAAFGEARHSRRLNEIRLEGLAEARGSTVTGRIATARGEWHPLGEVPLQQSDFSGQAFRVTLAAAAYRWWNTDDVRPTDAQAVRAVEISAAARGHRVFIDAEFEHLVAESVDAELDIGLYADGHATLDKGSLEVGYMLSPSRLELASALDFVAGGPDRRATWRRAAAGAVYYLRRHDLKLSLMHRESFGDGGLRGRRSRATYLQAQFAF